MIVSYQGVVVTVGAARKTLFSHGVLKLYAAFRGVGDLSLSTFEALALAAAVAVTNNEMAGAWLSSKLMEKGA